MIASNTGFRLFQDIRNILFTFTVALSVGWIFLQIGMPAPYLMGALFGVWISGAVLPPLRQYLGVARWFHVPIVVGLGVLIGATFRQETISQVSAWWLTMTAMIVVTGIVTLLGYLFLHKRRGYEPRLALLCCIPGGQVEAITMAREMVDKDYVVALFHLVRVVIIFISTPFLLAVIEGHEAVERSNTILQVMPSIFDLNMHQISLFIGLATVGYLVARLCRIPMPHILGPIGLSSLAHLTGWAELPRVNEFVILAQLVIGGAIGSRLAKVPFRDVFGYLKDATVNVMIILSGYVTVAIIIAHISHVSFLSIWLAFVPGGLYEVTLLALVFGFDVAFVAFHHTLRTILVFMSLPILINRLKGSKSS
ncbi:MAG: AbrB family transcriptional regulator [Candidatus Puniceispirillum sp.]|nr:AbrB family transcriptional regulator [Candidatus Puniceispirillum sp.]